MKKRARIDPTAPMRAVVRLVEICRPTASQGGMLALECGHAMLWRRTHHSDPQPKSARCEICLMKTKGLL